MYYNEEARRRACVPLIGRASARKRRQAAKRLGLPALQRWCLALPADTRAARHTPVRYTRS